MHSVKPLAAVTVDATHRNKSLNVDQLGDGFSAGGFARVEGESDYGVLVLESKQMVLWPGRLGGFGGVAVGWFRRCRAFA